MCVCQLGVSDGRGEMLCASDRCRRRDTACCVCHHIGVRKVSDRCQIGEATCCVCQIEVSDRCHRRYAMCCVCRVSDRCQIGVR